MSVLTAAADLRLAPPRAWMWAFVGLALVNAVELAPLGAELAGWDRLVFHLYDAGHMVALGLVGRLIGWAWLRWGPRRHGDLALAVAGTVVFGPLLLGDASSFIARQAETGSVLFWKTLIAAAPGVAFFVILRAPHRRLRVAHRALAVAAGLMLQHINHHGLPSDYTGLHLLTTVLAASVIAVGVSHPAPKRKDQTPKRPQLKRAGLTLTSLGAAATLLIHPGDATWRRLFASSGSVLAPFLARLARPGLSLPPREPEPWFDVGAPGPAIAARARVLPDDAIVIVISVDALRADVVNGALDDLPGIARLRERAVHFTEARSPTPSTATTLASVFTSRYYSQLYWSPMADDGRLGAQADHQPRFPELLAAVGVVTIHVRSAEGFGASWGIGRGFREEIPARAYSRASPQMDLILDRLEQGVDGPTFIFSHFLTPHAPYDRGVIKGDSFEAYLSEVQLVDHELVRLQRTVRTLGLADRTSIILTADHGEAFEEHGVRFHTHTVYDEVLRVPLLVAIPGAKPRRVDTPVSLIDLGPTTLDLMGVDTPAEFMGESLVPLLLDEPKTFVRPLAFDSGRRMKGIVFPDGYKVILDDARRTRELYDLVQDPGETINLVDHPDEGGRDALRQTEAFFDHIELQRPGYEVPWRRF